jgi:hypothetical protein
VIRYTRANHAPDNPLDDRRAASQAPFSRVLGAICQDAPEPRLSSEDDNPAASISSGTSSALMSTRDRASTG